MSDQDVVGAEVGVERQRVVPVLQGWTACGRCQQDPKWVHVTPLRASDGASLAAMVDYPAEQEVVVDHGCGVPATVDLTSPGVVPLV